MNPAATSSCSSSKDQSTNTLTPDNESELEEVNNRFILMHGGQVVLTIDEESGIATLLLDHPEKKNCLSGKMITELSDALTKLEDWKTGKGLIIYSEGDVFCSGIFLKTIKQLLNPDEGQGLCKLLQDIVTRLRRLPLVTVTMVQGKALGAGAEMLLATDFRLYTARTEVAYIHIKMGITTVCGGGVLLKDLVGYQKALDFLLTGRTISSTEAIKIGMAEAIVETLEDAHKWLLERVGPHHYTVVRANKLNIAGNSFENERKQFASLWGSDIQKEKLRQNIKHK